MTILETPLPTNQQTMGADKDDREKIRIGSVSNSSGKTQVTIERLTSKELELLEGAMHGHQWVLVSDLGRLRAIPTYKALPAPDEDLMMQPFWRPAVEGLETQLELFELEMVPEYSIPSIIIQSLCGYSYSYENYARQARSLQSWGFECLRSRRNDAGRFHEMWVLSSTYSARGNLKEAIEKVQSGAGHTARRLDAAIDFLCRNSSFGTLEVAFQKAAMVID